MRGKIKFYKGIEVLKKAKCKLKRKFYKLVVTAILVVSLAACGKNNQSNNYYNYDRYEFAEENNNYVSDMPIVINDDNFDSFVEEKVDNNITTVPEKTYEQSYLDEIANMNVTLNEIDVNEAINEISNIEVNYRHSELYELDAALKKYEEVTQNDSEISINLNYNLYDVVKRNNSEYLKNYTGSKYKQLPDSKLLEICNLLMESINYEIQNNDVEIGDLYKKLDELKIFDFNEFVYACYDQTSGMLAVSLNAVGTLKKEKGYERLIYHEGKHIVQANYDEIKSDTDMQYGLSYKWGDLNVNSLYCEWFFETSAEQLTLNQTDMVDPNVYENGLRCFKTIKVATLLNNNNEVNSLENLTLQGNLEKLYNYFDCRTPQEEKEILKMMFAYNILISKTSNTSAREFLDYYYEKNGKKMDDFEQRYYDYELSGSISSTLAKVFYKNLLTNIENKEVSLKDLFSMMVVFETEISKQCRYYEESKAEYLNSFYSEYVSIQNEFLNVLANKLNISTSELEESYSSYLKSFEFSDNKLLSKEKNELYKTIYTEDKEFKKQTISNYYEQYYGNITAIKR